MTTLGNLLIGVELIRETSEKIMRYKIQSYNETKNTFTILDMSNNQKMQISAESCFKDYVADFNEIEFRQKLPFSFPEV